MRTPTDKLADALDILARDIESGDGVANAAIAEAAGRLRERFVIEDRFIEARECLQAIHALPIEHDEKGHAFKRIRCRSMDDMGAWVGLVCIRLANGAEAPNG